MSFHFVSFAVQMFLILIRFHLFIFALISVTLEVIREDLAVIYIREGTAHVFFLEFYSVWPYISVFNPFWAYFCVWC